MVRITNSMGMNLRKLQEIVADFIFLGLKITMDLDCSHKIKRHLLLGRKKGYETPALFIKTQRLTLLQRSLVSKL